MTAPIVIAGTTAPGKRFVQFWTDKQSLAGRTVNYCWAAMTDDTLSVDSFCPDALLTVVFDTYRAFRAGVMPDPTHTAKWGYGRATFTPILPAPDAGLFDLEGSAA